MYGYTCMYRTVRTYIATRERERRGDAEGCFRELWRGAISRSRERDRSPPRALIKAAILLLRSRSLSRNACASIMHSRPFSLIWLNFPGFIIYREWERERAHVQSGADFRGGVRAWILIKTTARFNSKFNTHALLLLAAVIEGVRARVIL